MKKQVTRATMNYRARVIWEKHWNEKIPNRHHIHHKDGDWMNNCINNLLCVSVLEHAFIHKIQGDSRAYNILVKDFNKPRLKNGPFSDKAMSNFKSAGIARRGKPGKYYPSSLEGNTNRGYLNSERAKSVIHLQTGIFYESLGRLCQAHETYSQFELNIYNRWKRNNGLPHPKRPNTPVRKPMFDYV